MTWCHYLWNHARIGNLPAIQTVFAEGQASPFDVNLHGSDILVYAVGHTSPGIVRSYNRVLTPIFPIKPDERWLVGFGNIHLLDVSGLKASA